MKGTARVLLALAVCAGVAVAQASVIIDTVPVGNPGNPGQVSGDGGNLGPLRVCGAVGYTYNIGKYEVTAGQYTQFLNAVAATDTYGLWVAPMSNAAFLGCQIIRSGSSGSYTYSVAADYANRPVNFVGTGNAARFANWMANGQPTGPEGLATTEDGPSYYLNGADSNNSPGTYALIVRKPAATWVIPNEDEWYKAAYHKNDGVTGNYWAYPTSSNTAPGNLLPDPGNSACYFSGAYTIGAPYYRTPAGAFTNSASPYSTFDQGGNIFELCENEMAPGFSVMRGGSFNALLTTLNANNRDVNQAPWFNGQAQNGRYTGFRLGLVPEPASLALLALGLLGLRVRR